MIRQGVENRLTYLSGGVASHMGMWPSAASANWWDVAGETCVAAYQPKGAASLAASYSNLANPGTYDAAPGVAPTWASGTGWTFNGSTQYLTTGIIPDANYTAIVRVGNPNTSALNSVMSTRDDEPSTARFGLTQVTGALFIGFGDDGNSTYPAINGASGVWAIASNQVYIDSVLRITSAGTFTGPSVALPIGARNYDGTIDRFYLGDILAFAIYSTTLDATQISDLTDAMNAL